LIGATPDPWARRVRNTIAHAGAKTESGQDEAEIALVVGSFG
jgi:hypothetical protein